jgi:DNA-binding transcriptional regulator YbjK
MTSTSPTLSAPATGRRRELLDAAVGVVADEGLRGLTHRAVDRRAGLPEGTCSAYLRTKQVLLLAVTGHVAATLASDIDRLALELADCDGEEEQAVARTLALFERWIEERQLVLAKLELSLEAPRNPAVAEVLTIWRSRLVDVVDGMLTRACELPGQARAEALVASFDGLLIAALQKPPAQRRAFLGESLPLVLHALTGTAD